MRKTTLIAIAASFLTTAAFASDDHSSHSDHSDHSSHDHSDHSDHGATHGGVQAEVTINSMADGTVNLTHGPIPEINWPSMTMDLNLLEGAEVGDVIVGGDAMMTLEKGEDGMYAIRALMPMQ